MKEYMRMQSLHRENVEISPHEALALHHLVFALLDFSSKHYTQKQNRCQFRGSGNRHYQKPPGQLPNLTLLYLPPTWAFQLIPNTHTHAHTNTHTYTHTYRYHVVQQPTSERYLAALYWAYTTLGTVGYGDITATSVPERIFAIFAMIFGSVIYASIFGTLTTLITNMDRNKERYNSRVSVIREFCVLNNMPKFILNRLRAYLDATWVMRKGLSVDEVMEGVPKIVKSEIMMFIYADLIRQVPLFSNCDRRFLEQVVLKFKPQVSNDA
jgi:hypothetical protein